MKLRYLRERKQGGQGDARHLIRLEQELLNLANIKVLLALNHSGFGPGNHILAWGQ